MTKSYRIFIILFGSFFILSCSSYYKKRQDQREKVASSTGLFCEFVSGDEFTDVDVEINLRMAKRCDLNKPTNITNYRNASDNFGIVYCCQVPHKDAKTLDKGMSTASGESASTGKSLRQNAMKQVHPISKIKSPTPPPAQTPSPADQAEAKVSEKADADSAVKAQAPPAMDTKPKPGSPKDPTLTQPNELEDLL